LKNFKLQTKSTWLAREIAGHLSSTKQYRREWEIKLGWPRVNKPVFQDYQGKMACLQSETADEVQTDGMS